MDSAVGEVCPRQKQSKIPQPSTTGSRDMALTPGQSVTQHVYVDCTGTRSESDIVLHGEVDDTVSSRKSSLASLGSGAHVNVAVRVKPENSARHIVHISQAGVDRSKSRDGLYRAYKDVAFSQLFGLDQPQEQRLQSSWTGVPRACSLKDRVDVAQGVKSVGNARLAILKARLVEGHVHGPHGVDWKDDGNESKQQWSRFDLLVPEGFEGTQIEQYESFVLSEGANVFNFLEYLKDSAQSDDMDPPEQLL